ncbi:MAG: hypothetical protein WA830_20350, partial [Candidatus Sulfotelmatobacter sp.]
MTFFRRKRVANSGANKYAGVEDFRRVFSDDRDALHRLALLLTGDKEKAEQCFVAGLEDSVNTNGVFKEWARTWAKRVIIQNAISLLKPGPGQHAASSPENVTQNDVRLLSIPDRDVAISSVLALEDFERFVFAITALEGYSEHQCASLLNSSVQDVRNARIRATEHIATAEHSATVAVHSSTGGQVDYAAGLA